MEDDLQKRYPITWAVLRNAIDRIAGWKNVTPQAKQESKRKLRALLLRYQTRYRKEEKNYDKNKTNKCC